MTNQEKNKIWEKPILKIINLKYTESGSINASSEGSFWIFTWGGS